MSLYEGLDVEVDTKESWGSQIKLLQSQLQLKKSHSATKTKSRHPSYPPVGNTEPHKVEGALFATVINNPINESTLFSQPITNDLEDKVDNYDGIDDNLINKTDQHGENSQSSGIEDDFSLTPFEDEYDPRYPNDYDKIMLLREEARERERLDDWRKEFEDRDKRRREKMKENNATTVSENKSGVAIGPPPSVLSDVNAIIVSGSETETNKGGKNFAPTLHNSVAAKIMAKYGFKHGQGLGKSEQGMSQALQVEKTSKRGGKILHEKDLSSFLISGTTNQNNTPHHYAYVNNVGTLAKSQLGSLGSLYGEDDTETNELNAQNNNTENINITPDDNNFSDQNSMDTNTPNPNETSTPNNLTQPKPLQNNLPPSSNIPPPLAFMTPSKVILLRNMVGPGEVDPELEEETKEECSKYGPVRGCTVFEIPASEKGISELDRVRIFVEFIRVESAIKAQIDLNGRFFGGRIVRADFYNLDRYRTFDLGEGI